MITKQRETHKENIWEIKMDEEIKTFIKVWVSAIIFISYCYYFSTRIKTGVLRLLSVLPVCVLFLVFPVFFSSTHFNFTTSIFLSWLANFKLVLFVFDEGPLFPLPPNLSLFICFTSLPISPLQNPKSHPIPNHPSQDHIPKWIFPIKVFAFSVILHMYDYKQDLPPKMLSAFYMLHLYLFIEITFIILKVVVSISLGCNLEAPFKETYLATSLQDFWGRRWNLTTSDLLRLTVFNPVRKLCKRIMNADLAYNIGILATFLASGVIHDVILVYQTRETPTWEVTCFFVLHGVCRVMETTVKRMKFARWLEVNPVVSRILTMGFMLVTCDRLFMPPFKRSGVMERLTNETSLIIDFVKRTVFRD